MSALISAPDLDPFALISSEHYRIVRDGLRFQKDAQCNNAARKAKSIPRERSQAIRLLRSALL